MKKLPKVIFAVVILTLLAISADAQQVFVANLSSAQEVPSNVTTGKGVATVTLNAAETQINIVVNFSGLSVGATAGHIHSPAPVGVNAGVQIGFTGVPAATSGTITNNNVAITATQLQHIRSGQGYVNIHTSGNPGGEIRGQLKLADTFGDFDGDGKFDIGVFRPGNSTFYILNSLNSSVTTQPWGQSGDTADSQADFDGDGRTDFNAVRDVAGSLIWYILQSSNNTLRAVAWGTGGMNRDFTQPADYDGDGKGDVAVFRRSSNGTFYVLRSSDGGLTVQQWGSNMDEPVSGDFDKDGKIDFAVVRDAGGVLTWYILQSSNSSLLSVQWGITGDQLPQIHSDFDLDGKADIVVWRPANGTWYVRQSSNGALLAAQFGLNGDNPGGVDTDGDGKADFAVIRNVSGSLVFYILQSSNGAFRAVQWGTSGDEPV